MVRLVLAVFALLAVVAAPAFGLADHTGWPPREPGMLLMNKTDSTRPLDARPGHDPFGGRDSSYSCDELGRRPSGSCGPRFERADGGYVVTNREGHNRLLGGHGNDRIHAAPWGDVIWGDYKPTNQTTRQRDHLYGGAGPDFIYASHGRNVIKSGPGSDVIHALYGHGTIDCGKGRDALYLPAKKGAYKLKNCEWKKKRFGESAPKWFLNKLPWAITNE